MSVTSIAAHVGRQASGRQVEVARIKAACKAHGYVVTVRHGKGTAWGWLTIDIHNPVGAHDCGLYGDAANVGHGCSPHCQACAKRRVWKWDVWTLTCEATNRTTAYQQDHVKVNARWTDQDAISA